jgi:hypothetical protein
LINIYKTRYKYFRSVIIYVQNWRVFSQYKNNQRTDRNLTNQTSATVFSFYIFTFLIYRKLNKPQLTKNKQQNIISIHAFDSRLYLDIWRSFKWKESFIFRYFKVCQVSQMFTCGLSDLLSCDRFVGWCLVHGNIWLQVYKCIYIYIYNTFLWHHTIVRTVGYF